MVAEVGLVQVHQTKGAAPPHLPACIRSCILSVPQFTCTSHDWCYLQADAKLNAVLCRLEHLKEKHFYDPEKQHKAS